MKVTLRRWSVDDAAWYADAAHDPDIQHFTKEGDVTVEQMAGAIRRLADREGVFAIADAETGRPVGNIGWHRVDAAVAEIYYWVEGPSRRRGAAHRALELTVAEAAAAGFGRVRLVIDVDNDASRALAVTTGFEPVGPGDARDRDGHTVETVVYERSS